MVPVADHPDMNFLGLLIGPRGATQKSLEQQSGARILLRGAGASRDVDDSNEPMHVLIIGETDTQIEKAEQLVNELLHNPEKMMEIKSQQLKKVAQLQGSTATGVNELPQSSDESSIISTTSKDSRSHELRISTDKVGLIIGRQGETIRSLESLTGAQIQIAKEIPGSHDRIVTVVGAEDSITRAVEEITRIVSATGGSSNSHARNGGNSGVGSEVEKIAIPNNLVGLLIGRSGETVKTLQARTGCLVNIQRESEMAPSATTREVTLTGSREQVDAARREIESLMNGTSATESGSRRIIVNMRVPSLCVGTIIGKKGETIRQLQQMTGAKIQLDRNENNKSERELTIIGDAEQVERAKNEVEELIREKQQSGSGGGMGNPNYARHGGGQQQMPQYYNNGQQGYGGYQPNYPPHAAYQQQQQYPHHQDPNYYGGHYGQYPQSQQSGYGADPYQQHQQQSRSSHGSDGNSSPTNNRAANSPQQNSSQSATSESSPGSITLPTPPQDEAAFTAYWAALSYEQQQEYYKLYYPEMLAQISGQAQ